MNASVAIGVALLLPVAAAVLALVLADTRGDRSAPALLMVLAAAGAATATALAITGSDVTWRGFHADGWRGLLAATGLLCAAAGSLRATSAQARAAIALAGGLAAASALAPNLLWVGLLLMASSAAFGVVLYTSEGSASGRVRPFAPVALSDALVMSGLMLAASDSLTFGVLEGPPGALILAGGALRLALIPGVLPRGDDAPLATVLGPLRTQGALLCGLAVAGSTGRAGALAAIAAGAGGLAWAAAVARNGRGAIAVAPASLLAAGLAVGGAAGNWGAVVALVAATVGSTIAIAAGRLPAALAFSPLSAGFAALALSGGAVMRLAAARAEYVPVALGVLLAVAGAAASGWSARFWRPPGSGAPARAPRFALAAVVIPAIVALGVVAFAPAISLEHGIAPIARSLGAASPLGPVSETVPADLGIAIAMLALVGLIAGGARNTQSIQTGPPREASAPMWARGWAAPARVPWARSENGRRRDFRRARQWMAGLAVAEVAAVVFTAVLFVAAGGRGWL